MTQWLKTLTASLCILTILLHLIPEGKFGKYVKFYAGLLFFLVAAGPILKLFAGEGELERLLRLEFVKEEYYDLSTSAEGMAELKNDEIMAAYRKELIRQVEEIAAAYGVEASEVELVFDGSEEYALTGITFYAAAESGAAVEAAREELSGVFAVEPNRIIIRRREA